MDSGIFHRAYWPDGKALLRLIFASAILGAVPDPYDFDSFGNHPVDDHVGPHDGQLPRPRNGAGPAALGEVLQPVTRRYQLYGDAGRGAGLCSPMYSRIATRSPTASGEKTTFT